MTDYRCDHGYYAMGRDCPTCQKEREEARKECAPEEALTRLQQAERERDEARARLEQATALLREWREDDGLPAATHTSKRGRTDAFLAGQPAPAKVVVDDAMAERACRVLDIDWDRKIDDADDNHHGELSDGMIATRKKARAVLVAALEGRG